jgi:uncharacterized protein (DUF302 family)
MGTTMAGYVFGKTVNLGFDEAVKKAVEALGKEGFGVLTEIDVAGTIKKKLDKDIPPYRILGACNPQFAHKALEAEPQIGALLPCNVVVRVDRQGKTQVEVMDPQAVLGLVGRADIEPIAMEVRSRLKRMLDSL